VNYTRIYLFLATVNCQTDPTATPECSRTFDNYDVGCRTTRRWRRRAVGDRKEVVSVSYMKGLFQDMKCFGPEAVEQHPEPD
jgi:hypothetical protein